MCRLECQQLQEQVLQLKQQNEGLQSGECGAWFSNAQSGLSERQRVIDAVYRSRCTWQDVGDAVLEVLNNDLVWDAVEASARQRKDRVSRGLEALLVQLDALDPNGDGAEGSDQRTAAQNETADGLQSSAGRSALFSGRRSSKDPVRLIQCRVCNGAGYINPSDGEDGASMESDSYLRKTLAQVLELKTALVRADARSDELERDLQATIVQSMQLKAQLQQIEYIKSHGVDSCIQTDLDDEEGVDLDEIMRAASSTWNSPETEGAAGLVLSGIKKRFTSKRDAQYEHLIVELKCSLDEKNTALVELRRAHKESQTRLLAAQQASQQEQEAHQEEVRTLKTSLTLALNHQNTAIEEKQAAMTLLLKKFDDHQSRGRSLGSITASVDDEDNDDADDDDDDDGEESDVLGLDFVANLTGDEFAKLDEVKRSEVVARRYSQAIVRVQKEYEDQKSLLHQAEEEIGQEDEKRRRTHSISLGNIVVSMASHPRDLFKALSTTQNELQNVRRASQRSSTLQTDRLLTLTTHLSHLSEELCMVRKRTKTEIEFWKLECEKVQNTSKAVVSDLQKTQLELQAANERRASMRGGGEGKCTLCEKHQTRLMDISSQVLLKETQNAISESSVTSSSTGADSNGNTLTANQLTQMERQSVSRMVLDIETLYATMSPCKQENARQLIAFAVFGEDVASGTDARAHNSAVGRRVSRMDSSRSSSISARRTSSGQDVSESIQRRLNSQLDPWREGNPVEEEERRQFSTRNSQPSSTERENNQNPNHGALSVSGTSMSGDPFSPSHRKKTVVRKILSEDEVVRRRDARACIRSDGTSVGTKEAVPQDAPDEEIGDFSLQYIDEGGESHGAVEYSSYVDPDGREVYYEGVEVDEGNEGDENRVGGSNETDALFNWDEYEPGHQVAHPNVKSEGALLSDIENDPDVIKQLRDLVKQNATVKEFLAMTNWKILVCHMRALRGQSRLEWVRSAAMSVGSDIAFIICVEDQLFFPTV